MCANAERNKRQLWSRYLGLGMNADEVLQLGI